MNRIITPSLLLVCVSPLFLPGGFWNKYWFGQWGVLIALCSIAYGVWVGRALHWSFAPITVSTLLSALWVYGNRYNQYQSFSATDQFGIQAAALYSALSFVMLSFCVVVLKKYARVLMFSLGVICLVASVWTITQIGAIPWKRAGFVGNASMNGSLVAITLPFALTSMGGRKRWLFAITATVAVVLTGASVPVGVLALVMAVLLIARRYVPLLLILLSSLFSVAYAVQGNVLFNPSGRFGQWKILMDWWSWSASPWFGAGAGTSVVLMPYAQKLAGVKDGFYMWAHNDWLQILFEQGVVGFAAAILAVCGVIFLTVKKRDRTLLAALVGYAGMAVFNYPLHLPVHAAVGAWLVALSVKGGDPDGEEEED